MAAKNGNIVLIGVGGRDASHIIGGARSCVVNINGETIEVSSNSNPKYKEYIAGQVTWELSLGYMVYNLKQVTDPDSSQITSILNVGTTYNIYIGERDGMTIGGTYLTGQAILKGVNITANRGKLIEGTITFQGTGPLV